MKPKITYPYINIIKRGNSKIDIYVRRYRSNCRAIKIKAPIGSPSRPSPDYLAEYANALKIQEAKGKPLASSKNSNATVNWLYKEFKNSPERTQLD